MSRSNNIAYDPPFVVPVRNIPRELDDMVPLFTGFVMAEVSRGAAKNDARRVFEEFVQNDDRLLATIVQTTADVTMYFIEKDRPRSNLYESILSSAAELVVNGSLVDTIQRNRNVFQNLLTNEMVDGMAEYQRSLQNVFADMDDFYNRGRRGRDDRDNGYRGNNVGNRGVWNGNRNDRNDNRRDDYRSGGNDYQNRGDVFSSHTRQQTTDTGNAVGRVARVVTPRMESRSGRVEAGVQQGSGQRGRAPVRGTELVDGVAFVPASPDMLWPKVENPEDPWNWFLLENGTQFRPAHRSTWKVTLNPLHPATIIYNPQTHILFHARSKDGIVAECTYQRTPHMDSYLDHELDPTLRLKAVEEIQRNAGKSAGAWKLAEQLRPNPESPLSTGAPLDESAEAMAIRPIKPDQYILTSALSDGLKRAVLKLKVDHPKLVDAGFELYADRMELTEVAYPDFEALKSFSGQDSFKGLFNALMDYRGKADLRDAVNKRITEGLNRALQKNLGLTGWSVDNFCDDLGDLLKVMEEQFGAGTVNVLEENAEDVISKSLSHFGKDEQEIVREQFELGEGLDVLVWRERCSMTYLPAASTELQLPIGNGMMVTPTDGPEVFKTIAAIFDRTPDMPESFYGRYLTTTDGVVYELVRGFFNNEAYMLYPATLK